MIDGEAMWSSDKLGRCAQWARREYAWLYPLADANGCFELTNLHVIHGLVSANREDLTCVVLQRVFAEFTRNGLLFTWEENGKTYGYWTKSEGRLPPPSQRKRHKLLAPSPPGRELAQYLKSFYINEVNNHVDLGQARVRVLGLDLDREKKERAPPQIGSQDASKSLFLPFEGAKPKKTKGGALLGGGNEYRKFKPRSFNTMP